MALTQCVKDEQDILHTWSCCGAAGCKAAGAAGMLGADDCADPEGACTTYCSVNQSWVCSGIGQTQPALSLLSITLYPGAMLTT